MHNYKGLPAAVDAWVENFSHQKRNHQDVVVAKQVVDVTALEVAVVVAEGEAELLVQLAFVLVHRVVAGNTCGLVVQMEEEGYMELEEEQYKTWVQVGVHSLPVHPYPGIVLWLHPDTTGNIYI